VAGGDGLIIAIHRRPLVARQCLEDRRKTGLVALQRPALIHRFPELLALAEALEGCLGLAGGGEALGPLRPAVALLLELAVVGFRRFAVLDRRLPVATLVLGKPRDLQIGLAPHLSQIDAPGEGGPKALLKGQVVVLVGCDQGFGAQPVAAQGVGGGQARRLACLAVAEPALIGPIALDAPVMSGIDKRGPQPEGRRIGPAGLREQIVQRTDQAALADGVRPKDKVGAGGQIGDPDRIDARELLNIQPGQPHQSRS